MAKHVPAARKEYTWESENPYYEKKKYPEPTVCEDCGAVYRDGRWQWPQEGESFGPDVNKALCPACRRKRDKYPGGFVYLSGSFFKEKREEIMNRINNTVEEITAQRPLHRILWIKDTEDGVEIATTTERLARHIGEAVYSAFKGELDVNYNENEKLARVFWRRDLP